MLSKQTSQTNLTAMQNPFQSQSPRPNNTWSRTMRHITPNSLQSHAGLIVKPFVLMKPHNSVWIKQSALVYRLRERTCADAATWRPNCCIHTTIENVLSWCNKDFSNVCVELDQSFPMQAQSHVLKQGMFSCYAFSSLPYLARVFNMETLLAHCNMNYCWY